ncbi:hypothetical protein PIB30_036133 [Stylosanthes scabra]|uniref:Uncharacterized protein n=1 Tax=Stylosanthes scabra TaxID=79078 RepID=A0ABU6WBR1_9FABA|nr:hypothetical protein [Stylosanthes scabra]
MNGAILSQIQCVPSSAFSVSLHPEGVGFYSDSKSYYRAVTFYAEPIQEVRLKLETSYNGRGGTPYEPQLFGK